MTEGMRGKSLEELQKTYKGRPVEDVLMYVAANQDLISAKQDFLKEDIDELKQHVVKQNGNVARNVDNIAKNALAIGKNETHLEDVCKKLDEFIEDEKANKGKTEFVRSKYFLVLFILLVAVTLTSLGVNMKDIISLMGWL